MTPMVAGQNTSPSPIKKVIFHRGWTQTNTHGKNLTENSFFVQNCQEPGEPQKKTSHFPLYWLVDRDPYNGLI